MSKSEMRETCEGLTEDHAVINQYCKITGKGEISKLRSIIIGGFGHCHRTADERIAQLIESSVILTHGKFWKYNKTGNNEYQKEVDLLKSLRDTGTKGTPQSEESIDEANRLKYRASQEVK